MESLALQMMAIVLGASVGSFLNVVVYRLPAGLSVLYPPSRCPHCLRRLSPRDNIPVLGWFLIKGKCRHCHASVSFRYPLVEAVTAALFWLVAIVFGASQPILVLVFYCLFLSWLFALALIDLDTMTLPNVLTESGLLAGLVCQVLTVWITRSEVAALSDRAIASVTGAVLGIWLLDIARWSGRFLLQKEAMGAGDPKLAAAIGAWLGWQHLLLAILVAAVCGTLVGIVVIALGKLGREQAFPFGPFLALGGAISLFFGNAIVATYLNWFGFV